MTPREDRDWFPELVKRFVDTVERGDILKTTEFAGAVSVTASNLLRDAGACRFDSGATIEAQGKVVLLFHCKSDLAEQGLSAWLDWDGATIKRIDVMTNQISPETAH